MERSVLVLFKEAIPAKPASWWKQFDTVIGPSACEAEAKEYGCAFVQLDTLVGSGSVQDAAVLVRELSLLKASDGNRVSRMGTFEGYGLWWIHYDDLYYRFCLPFTQYERLLQQLKQFDSVHLYQSPVNTLFRYYLEARSRKVHLLENPTRAFPTASLWIQAILSLPFFCVLLFRRSPLMVWTSDLFDPPRDHDFRMKFVYEELHARKMPFVEFIRSVEPWRTVLDHAIRRRRPVIYSHALASILRLFAGFAIRADTKRALAQQPQDASPEDAFRFLVATHYLRSVTGDRWSIRLMQFITRAIGIRAAIIPTGVSRTFHEVIACKRAGIPMAGILHGIASKDYNVYDFMPEFDGEKPISIDRYGMWSDWWKEYYLENGNMFKPEQLPVCGPMRPLPADFVVPPAPSQEGTRNVLFISEQLGVHTESVRYLEALLDAPDLTVYVKFRSYRDGFETWLSAHRPDILERIPETRLLRAGMNEAVAACNVVVGSHSTGVVESLLVLKPFVLFCGSKWGDYFELDSFHSGDRFLARTPEAFVSLVRESGTIPAGTLRELQQRLFGDPYQNGSHWLVAEAQKLLSR